jgi:hypothetical protein
MTTSETSMRFWKRGLAAMGVLTSLALAPAPAQAQICGELDDIADDLLDAYIDVLEEVFSFPLFDEKTCDSMAKAFLKQCDTAVKDAVKCSDRQLDGIPKVAKPACKLASKNPSQCDDDFKELADAEKQAVDDLAPSAHEDCEDAADELFDICRNPI